MRFLISALLAATVLAQASCFGGVKAGEQYATIKNVVSLAAIGTTYADVVMKANNSAVNSNVFPGGYSFLSSSVKVTGLVNNPLTKSFFDGTALAEAKYSKVFQCE